MKKNLVSKSLTLGIVLLLFVVGVSPGIGIFSNKKKLEEENIKEIESISATDYDTVNKFADTPKIRIFLFCNIEAYDTGGRAYLIPGYFNSLNNGLNVKGASGFCLAGNKTETQPLYINEEAFSNWQWIIVSLYTGLLYNNFLTNPGVKINIFDLVGKAVLVIISYLP
jgi:hypothetical protein